MLFDYLAPGLQSLGGGTVWSQFPLQPLAPGVLTPFSYSVLAELASRAWYVYYDRLGFDPTPRSKVVRRHKGHVYFNLSLSAQMEADHAGLEPLTLHINQQHQPLAKWEKPNFLAGFKLGRAQKKIDDLWVEYAHQLGAITENARTWYLKTQGIHRWGQAEVLQIMEEIERIGVESMVALLAARHQLAQHYAHLVADLSGKATNAQAMLLINNALGDISGLVESAMLDALLPIADAMRNPESLAWLKAGDFAAWRTELPSQEAIAHINDFLATYGHRAVHEGEIARPRWSEDVSLLMQAVLMHCEEPRKSPVKASASAHLQKLLDMLPSSARKQGEQTIQKLGELHKLQSNALQSLAYIGAGTRSWALAAAREAMVDKRLHSTDEVFCFELEEIKQMMTGEWNISSLDEIRDTTVKRQIELAAAKQETAPDILVGDDEAFVSHDGLPGVVGKATGPLCLLDTLRLDTTEKQDCRGAIVATELLDSGCVLTLPFAAGFVTTAGTPCDPFVVAAHSWQRPVVVSMAKNSVDLAEGASIAIEVTTDTAKVSRV